MLAFQSAVTQGESDGLMFKLNVRLLALGSPVKHSLSLP
jgi:hypothetical protein